MKNWTVKEAVAVINAGTDVDAIKEIVKHFPLFAVIVAGKDFDAFAAAMPENLTVRKVENELNNNDVDSDKEGGEEAEVSEEEATEDVESMSTKQLIALCGKKGIKVPKYGKNKQFYIDALNGGADDASGEEDEEDEEDEDPVALYKQCKKAGLKVKPKQTADYYKKQLATLEEAEADEDDEDWGDEEEEEAPKKTSKKADKKPAKKAAKKEEPEDDDEEDDDDDDWDI